MTARQRLSAGVKVPSWAERAVPLLGIVVWLACLLRWGHLAELVTQWQLVAAFGVVIAVGEYFRFTLEDGREVAPM